MHPLKLAVALPLAGMTMLATAGNIPTPPPQVGLCAACHGRDGVARRADTPNLAGQRYDYLRKAMNAYRSGRREVPLMRAALGPLSTAQLDTLARWYAAQRPVCRKSGS